jgi:hypothetical protein
MATKKTGRGARTRLAFGAAILANARVVDTGRIGRRLTAFTTAHRNYAAAQKKLDGAEEALRAAGAQAARCEQEVDAAVEALALAMANDGHSRAKPFAALGAVTPSTVRNAAIGDKPDAVRQLAHAAQQSRAAGRKTCDAARAAEQAADKLQAALIAVGPLELTVTATRSQRDTQGQAWDRTLSILRRDVRSAEDEGAAGLYGALFGLRAPVARKVDRPPATPPLPAPTAESPPPATSTA